MAFPTGFNMDNGVLQLQWARGRFLLTILEQAEWHRMVKKASNNP
jgi:hypothetical protein